jgi:hypothetical protein
VVYLTDQTTFGQVNMQESFARVYHRWRRVVSGPVLLFLAISVAGYCRPQHHETNKQRDKTIEEMTTKPLGATFFRETKQGQAILAYLSCIDFDCAKALQGVVKMGPDILPPFIQLLRHGVPPDIASQVPGDVAAVVRIRTVDALGAIADTRALTPLIAVLKDSSPVIRGRVADALGRIGGDPALTALLTLLQDEDQLVRETSAIALGTLKREEALPALRDAAKSESKPHIRLAMEAAIQKIEQH